MTVQPFVFLARHFKFHNELLLSMGQNQKYQLSNVLSLEVNSEFA